MEEVGLEQKKLHPLVAVAAVFFVVLVAGAVWFFKTQKQDYVIQNVPYITLYNHIGKNALVVMASAASLITVMEYQGAILSEADYQKINTRFFDPNDLQGSYGINDVQSYAEELGYDTTLGTFTTLADLKKYINPQSNTPLIFGHLLKINQNSKIIFSPFGVLIGVLEKENQVVVHDYYWGYNKKIAWDKFQKMAGVTYLVVRSKNATPIERASIPYPERTSSMKIAANLIDTITLARVAILEKKFKTAFNYYKKAVADEGFEAHVPPYYKVVAYTGVANGHLFVNKNSDKAFKFAKKAEAMNHDLDKPFGDFWPGFEDRTNAIISKFSGTYFSLGAIYEAQKKFDLAKQAYQEAINVYTDNIYAQDALQRLNKK